MPSIVMRMQLGPLVSIQIEGSTCREIAEALTGYEQLNKQIEGLCSGLADKVYPDHDDAGTSRRQGGAA
jgi:hypothetical protein